MNSRIFRGWTHHQRLEPVRHAFKYRIYWLGVDLDELDTLNRSVGGFGYNRWSLASMKAADYGGPGEGTLRDRVLERLGEHGIELGNTRIMLMTIRGCSGMSSTQSTSTSVSRRMEPSVPCWRRFEHVWRDAPLCGSASCREGTGRILRVSFPQAVPRLSVPRGKRRLCCACAM